MHTVLKEMVEISNAKMTATSSMITTMVDRKSIQTFVDGVAERFRPQKIILFGSYANGKPSADSDVDLLIVKNHRGPGHELATRIRQAVEVSFPMDLLVRSPAELRKSVREDDWFIIDLLENGITLYDAANRAVGEKGRRRLGRRLGAAAVT
ncbi:MAG TPA: nucleotidyltransferase domain-containing protein [Tepidisphaeraceae bacterium]|jgi:predicted nucleotidyltransferase|nr:nucleotidyltransferase domain-containing protein [Tepidisphaeraceae bacterium]